MAKGQARSNRETKKPKQSKNPPLPSSTTTGTLARVGLTPTDDKKK